MKSITNDLVITCDKIVDTPETVLINSNDKKATYKIKDHIEHTFLLVTILLLKIVTIYYILHKTSIKKKNILPY